MKLGVANRISVTDLDTDDTVDIRPSYTEIVYLLTMREPGADDVAQAWLNQREAE